MAYLFLVRSMSAPRQRFLLRRIGFVLLAPLCFLYAANRIPITFLLATGLRRTDVIEPPSVDWLVFVIALGVAAAGIVATRRFLFWQKRASEVKHQ